ncbi:hypothetical protein [Flammeovirga sp. OC4]|uniref:hypothetical protein n=1 Tax=Flammeovirga sp. OC4 TaxID=1382345 RepID=UPI0005C722D4|nr:hypothetical protein [Flammeovirga sp. OC4]
MIEIITRFEEYDTAQTIVKKDELVKEIENQEMYEDRKKKYDKHLNSKIKHFKDKVHEVSHNLRAGGEEVKHECVMLIDPYLQRIIYVNANGLEIKTRPLKDEEKQLSLTNDYDVNNYVDKEGCYDTAKLLRLFPIKKDKNE